MAQSEIIHKYLVNLEVDGEIFSTELTAEEIETLSNDENAYLQKFQEIKMMGSSTGLEQPSGSSGSQESRAKWGPYATKLLISLRLQMEESFCMPKCKKTKMWNEISTSMRQNNYFYSGTECHAKYRNLLQTYKNNKDKRLKTGESKITWEYFEQFDEVLGYKNSTIPAENLLSTHLETESTSEAIPSIINESHDKNKEKKMSVTQYLYEKNKSREAREAKDDIRWEEKKRLKEKEIEAINNLADAIRGTYKRRRSTHSDSE